MSWRQVTLLVFVVILLHGAAFWALSGSRVLPPKPYIAPPSFIAKEARWVDEKTGEKMIYREFRVSTKLAETEVLVEKRGLTRDNPPSIPLIHPISPTISPTLTPAAATP